MAEKDYFIVHVRRTVTQVAQVAVGIDDILESYGYALDELDDSAWRTEDGSKFHIIRVERKRREVPE